MVEEPHSNKSGPTPFLFLYLKWHELKIRSYILNNDSVPISLAKQSSSIADCSDNDEKREFSRFVCDKMQSDLHSSAKRAFFLSLLRTALTIKAKIASLACTRAVDDMPCLVDIMEEKKNNSSTPC